MPIPLSWYLIVAAALFCIGLVMVWFALAAVIGIENKKMTKRGVESRDAQRVQGTQESRVQVKC